MDELQIRRILVATDLSRASEPAMELATDLAARADAEIILFHALSPVWFVGYGLVNRSEASRNRKSRLSQIYIKFRALDGWTRRISFALQFLRMHIESRLGLIEERSDEGSGGRIVNVSDE